jgi:hypothetical protein
MDDSSSEAAAEAAVRAGEAEYVKPGDEANEDEGTPADVEGVADRSASISIQPLSFESL